MSAEVATIAGHSSTEYKIVGPLDEVLEQIVSLFKQYPPQGYGTHVHRLQHENGSDYAARVSRMNSCD